MRQIDNFEINIVDRAKNFGIECIKLSSELPKNPAGYTIANQFVRSSTSIGANLTESQEAVSNADFVHKISISLKEAKETRYWINLILESQLLPLSRVSNLLQENDEIVRILIAIVKKLRLKK